MQIWKKKFNKNISVKLLPKTKKKHLSIYINTKNNKKIKKKSLWKREFSIPLHSFRSKDKLTLFVATIIKLLSDSTIKRL